MGRDSYESHQGGLIQVAHLLICVARQFGRGRFDGICFHGRMKKGRRWRQLGVCPC